MEVNYFNLSSLKLQKTYPIIKYKIFDFQPNTREFCNSK